MLNLTPPSEGLLFASFLYRKDLHQEEELKLFWEDIFGPSFAYVPETNPLIGYYEKEMGPGLGRNFFLTSKKYSRDSLLTTKLLALDWERSWAQGEERRVNVDIGFLSPENFLLATTKNYSHRIYIGQNIFADLTYHFHQGEFQVLPWTYPDFVDQKKIDFLTWGRSFLLETR